MTAVLRRGACPSLRTPMETGDGLLARLPRSESALTLATVRAIAAAAHAFGNGLIEVSARGAIQVRGLRPDTAGPFGEAVAALDLPDDVGPALISGPLSGRDANEYADVRPLVAALRHQIAEAGLADRLAPKVSIIVDGGGILHLDDVSADLRVAACPNADGSRFLLSLAGTAAGARTIGAVAPADAVPAGLALLRLIAEAGPEARARDLVAAMDDRVIRAATGGPLKAPVPQRKRPSSKAVGAHYLADGTVAVGVGLAFGQTDASSLEALVAAATDCGADCLAPTAGRALVAIGIARDRARTFAEAAERHGFVTRPNDPRRSIFACAGAPACAQGKMQARAVGSAIARAAAPILDGSIALHISGCTKGCAHPSAADIVFVGSDNGAGLVLGESANGRPRATIRPGDLTAAAHRFARVMVREQRPGETSAATLTRLGDEAVAALLHREPVDG